MRITITGYCDSKIAEFYDDYYASMFIERMLEDAYECGKKRFTVSVDFPEVEEEECETKTDS